MSFNLFQVVYRVPESGFIIQVFAQKEYDQVEGSSITVFEPILKKHSPSLLKLISDKDWLKNLKESELKVLQEIIDVATNTNNVRVESFTGDISQCCFALFVLHHTQDSLRDIKLMLLKCLENMLTLDNLFDTLENLDDLISRVTNTGILQHAKEVCLSFLKSKEFSLDVKKVKPRLDKYAVELFGRNTSGVGEFQCKDIVKRDNKVLSNLFNHKKTGDICVTVNKEKTKVLYLHKSVLCSMSPMLKTLFSNESRFCDVQDETIHLFQPLGWEDSQSEEALEIVLLSMYDSQYMEFEHVLPAILEWIHYLQIEVEFSQSCLLNFISEENFLSVASVISKIDNPTATKHIQQFASENFKSLTSKYPDPKLWELSSEVWLKLLADKEEERKAEVQKLNSKNSALTVKNNELRQSLNSLSVQQNETKNLLSATQLKLEETKRNYRILEKQYTTDITIAKEEVRKIKEQLQMFVAEKEKRTKEEQSRTLKVNNRSNVEDIYENYKRLRKGL